MAETKIMKSFLSVIKLLPVLSLLISYSCDKIEIIGPRMEIKGDHLRNNKPRRTPIQEGCIRGYFGDEYLTFTDPIEKVQPVDSFSNCYFYGSCNNNLRQINLIRSNSTSVLAIYILGYSIDSLPASLPVANEPGRFAEIQFYPFGNWNIDSPSHYFINNFYGENVFITNVTDDIVTGWFEGALRSVSGDILQVSEGEFKLRIFRKYIPCGDETKSD